MPSVEQRLEKLEDLLKTKKPEPWFPVVLWARERPANWPEDEPWESCAIWPPLDDCEKKPFERRVTYSTKNRPERF